MEILHGIDLEVKQGEIVAIKGGHIFEESLIEQMGAEADESYIQVEDNFYIGAMEKPEVAGNKLFLNHSCDPNVGIRGQITFVAMRNIDADKELVYDWAMENDWNDAESLKCNCGTEICRGFIRGKDWRLPELRQKYKGYFSAYIQSKIEANV